MKKKEIKDLRDKDLKKLLAEADKKREEIEKADVSKTAGKEKNLKKIKNLKRDLSQILTIIREVEIVAEFSGKKEVTKEK